MVGENTTEVTEVQPKGSEQASGSALDKTLTWMKSLGFSGKYLESGMGIEDSREFLDKKLGPRVKSILESYPNKSEREQALDYILAAHIFRNGNGLLDPDAFSYPHDLLEILDIAKWDRALITTSLVRGHQALEKPDDEVFTVRMHENLGYQDPPMTGVPKEQLQGVFSALKNMGATFDGESPRVLVLKTSLANMVRSVAGTYSTP